MGLKMACLSLGLLPGAEVALAQGAAAQGSNRPFEILDNSFLVEEAFNQEKGVFQNILTFRRSDGSGWDGVFVQEWPLGSQTHQVSYTVPVRAGEPDGLGDILINYRYQALVEGPERPALAPRVSLILPTGSERKGLGDGVVGWQLNLPASKQNGDVYLHFNAGLTFLPGVDVLQGVDVEPSSGTAGHEDEDVDLFSPFVASSVIWRARPMIHLLLETTSEWTEVVGTSASTARVTSITLSPGVRAGVNVGDSQIVLGAGVPLTFAEGETDFAFLGYLSYELPFQR